MSNYFGAMGTALYSTLSGAAGLITELGGTAIYHGVAPNGRALPYVVFSMQGGGPDLITKSDMHNNLWFVRGYASTQAQAVAIEAQIDAALNKKALTVTGWTNFWTVRETDLSLVETLPDNTNVYMAGAIYRIRLTD